MDNININETYHGLAFGLTVSYNLAKLDYVDYLAKRSLFWYITCWARRAGTLLVDLVKPRDYRLADRAEALATASMLYKIVEYKQKCTFTTKEEKIQASLQQLKAENCVGWDRIPQEFFDNLKELFEENYEIDPEEINEVNVCRYTKKLFDLILVMSEKSAPEDSTNCTILDKPWFDSIRYARETGKLLYTEETIKLMEEYL